MSIFEEYVVLKYSDSIVAENSVLQIRTAVTLSYPSVSISDNLQDSITDLFKPACILFVCVEVLRPSQPNGVMSSAVSLPNHTFTGQA